MNCFTLAEKEYQSQLTDYIAPPFHGWLLPSGMGIDLYGDDHRIVGSISPDDNWHMFIAEGGIAVHVAMDHWGYFRLNPDRITGDQKVCLRDLCAKLDQVCIDLYDEHGDLADHRDFFDDLGLAYYFMADRIAYELAVSEGEYDE